MTRCLLISSLALLSFAFAGQGELKREQIEPFLDEYCVDCHDDADPKGGLDLFTLPYQPEDPHNFETWAHVFDRIREGEMPPEKEEQPSEAERRQLLDQLRQSLTAIHRRQVQTKGRVRGRRLTRVEYEHTLHDLLGIRIPLSNKLPADESEKEFETVAEAQQLSHFHLNQYLNVADLALGEAFDRLLQGDKPYKRSFTPKELTRPSRGNYRGPQFRNDKAIMWAMRLQFAGRMTQARAPESGWYRISIKNLRGLNPGPDGSVWGTLRTGTCYSDEPILYYASTLEGVAQPKDHVCVAWMEKGHILELKPNEGTNKVVNVGRGGNLVYNGKDLQKQGAAGLAFEGITMERVYPGGNRKWIQGRLFPGIPIEDGKAQFGDKPKAIRQLIHRFASRAFRRPVEATTIAAYQDLALSHFKQSGSIHKALKEGYRAILCSPRFLTFVEKPGPLDDHAVASRLSYFLWSSLPDAPLRQAADQGKLRDRQEIARQVQRMLSDRRSERFIHNFTDQWLKLKEINFTTPDPQRFRSFDPVLQDSMVQETRAFLRELIDHDLSVRHFVKSDFTMLNTRLRTHYGLKHLKVIPGKGLQRVAVKPTDRSGLITQGSVLKVTADGSVTSPVLRGVFVAERILGRHIPPPPENVPAIEPDIRGAKSIRAQLEKHRASVSCASCHAKMDPPGFALENYDPTGQWRAFYGKNAKSAKVNPSGITPDGRKFRHIQEWKSIYAGRSDMLARAFASQLMTYATGAPVGFSDRPALEKIVSSTKTRNHGVRSILHAVATSELFLQK